MKIKKTLLSTEIEFTPQEIEQIYYVPPIYARVGIMHWIRKNFGLDLLPKEKNVVK